MSGLGRKGAHRAARGARGPGRTSRRANRRTSRFPGREPARFERGHGQRRPGAARGWLKYLATRALGLGKEAAFRGPPRGGGISHLCEGDGVRGGGGVADSGGTPDDVSLELVRAVLDAGLGLRAGQRAVDSGRRLGAVAAQKGAFVEEHDAAAVLEDGVRGGEPREASADDDDLFGHGASFPSLKTRKRVRAGGVVVFEPRLGSSKKRTFTRKVTQQTRSKIHRSGRRG